MNCSYSNEHDTAHMAIVAIVTINSAMFEAKRTKIYPQNAGSLSITTDSFHWARTSVFFRYTTDMLVSNNVQWPMEKKHFAVAMEQHTKLPVQGLHNRCCFNMQDLDG